MDAIGVNVNRRRLLLAGSTLGSYALVTAYSRPSAAHAGTAEKEAVTVELIQSAGSVFSTDFTSQLPYSVLLGAIIAGGSSDLARSTITVCFDERGQCWSGESAILQSNTTTKLRTKHSNIGSRGTLEIELPAGPGVQHVTVLFPLRQTRRYPAENVGPLGATTFRIAGPEIVPVAAVAVPDAMPSFGLAWGAEVLATWARTEDVRSSAGDSYAYPLEITLSSVGPGPVPSGSAVQIVADGAIIRSMSVASVSVDGATEAAWNFAPRNSSAQSGGVVVLNQALAAGSTLRIAIDSQLNSAPAISDSITYGRVTLISPPGASGMRRESLMESAATVSPSGTPLVTDGARGKT
jgi:hypothetical protein